MAEPALTLARYEERLQRREASYTASGHGNEALRYLSARAADQLRQRRQLAKNEGALEGR